MPFKLVTVNVAVPLPVPTDKTIAWATSPQTLGAIQVFLSASGWGGAWLIHNRGWLPTDLELLNGIITGIIALVPMVAALWASLRANSAKSIIQNAVNLPHVERVVVNGGTTAKNTPDDPRVVSIPTIKPPPPKEGSG